MDFEVLEESQPYSGRILSLRRDRVRLPNGHVSAIENILHGPSTAVVPVLPDGRILLERQFRYAAKDYILEIPAGVVNPGEPPEDCARRELEEETGYVAGALRSLGGYMLAPGYSDEVIHLFVAEDLEPGTQALEPSEVLRLETYSLDDLLAMIREGTLGDAKTVLGILLAFPRAGSGR
jgi:ADP-ribose pyrophosphatase